MNAADLPEGSVVATANFAYMKRDPWCDPPWESNSGARLSDSDMQDLLARGAKVLRVGRDG